MIHGILRDGIKAVTPISLPRGRFREITFFADNGQERLYEPIELRVALFDHEYGWKVLPKIYLDGAKGPVVITFDASENVGGISLQRLDNPHATVAWTAL